MTDRLHVDRSPSNVEQSEGKGFVPYEGTALDTPLVHFLFRPCLPALLPFLQAIYSIRWQLSRPLQVRILPRFVPLVPLPLLNKLPYLTLGQVLLATPLLILLINGCYFAFVSPGVERSGDIAAYAMFAVFLTANKTNSITSFLFGVPFERMIPFHNFAALITVALSCFHGYVAYAHTAGNSTEDEADDNEENSDSEDNEYGLLGTDPDLKKYLFDGGTNTSGSLLAMTMVLLVLTSTIPYLRRKFFDIWLWVHVLSALCVIIFATMHHVTTILAIAAWWGVDVLLRYVVMAGCKYPRRAQLELVTDDVVKISFEKPKGFEYNCGQFVQIALPDLGPLAFHPLSISSSPHEPYVTLHARALGDWSKRLLALAKRKEEVSVLIEGPYGSLSVDIDDDKRYEMVLCVCGGIGVTHCSSVAKKLIEEHRQGRKLKNIRFVWALRDLDMLRVLESSISTPAGKIEMTEAFAWSSRGIEVSPVVDIPESHDMKPPLEVVQEIFLTSSFSSPPKTLGEGKNLYYGRPDVDAIVADVKEQALGQKMTHVAVFACGPKALVDKLQNACRLQTKTLTETCGVTFDVHEEIFEF